MTLVCISWAFPPMNYPRAHQVARLAYHMNVPMKIVCAGQGEAGVKSEKLSITRLKLATWKNILDRIRYRLIPESQYCPDTCISWSELAADYVLANYGLSTEDVLITFGQPMSDHLAGLSIKKETGVPWIAHFSDPWVDNPMVARSGRILHKNRIQEKEVINNADAIIFTSKETMAMVMNKYPEEWQNKAHVIPHAFDSALYPDNGKNPDKSRIVLRYMGNFYGTRTPVPLFNALRRIMERTPEILDGVYIEIFGSIENDLKESIVISDLPEKCVTFYPSVDYRESLKLMTEADLLLVIDAPSELSVFLPSKLIDYIGAGRPIFGITPEGTSTNLIRELGGITADPENTEEVAARISEILDDLRAGKYSNPWGVKEVRERFEAENVAAMLYRLIEEVKQAA